MKEFAAIENIRTSINLQFILTHEAIAHNINRRICTYCSRLLLPGKNCTIRVKPRKDIAKKHKLDLVNQYREEMKNTGHKIPMPKLSNALV